MALRLQLSLGVGPVPRKPPLPPGALTLAGSVLTLNGKILVMK